MTANLASAAAFERDSRAKHYPSMVAGGELGGGEAERDWQAWTAIADVIAGGTVPAWADWPMLIEAAERALVRREEACAAEPANPKLAERRDWVAYVLQRLREKQLERRTVPA